MKKPIWVFIFFIFLFLPLKIFASDVVFFDFNKYVLLKINDFRSHPMDYFEYFGIEKSEVSDDWLEIIKDGMPSLQIDPFLEQMALAHIQHMVNVSNISHSSSYTTLEDRAYHFGYNGVFVGESIMVFGFENYVSPEHALDIMLDELFKDALLRKTKEGAPLLFKPYQDIGIGFGAAQINIDGTLYNAYILCMDFGVHDADGYFLARIYKKGEQPLPENCISNVQVVSWQDSTLLNYRRTIVYADGSFFIPYDNNYNLWLYLIPLDDQYTPAMVYVNSQVEYISLDSN